MVTNLPPNVIWVWGRPVTPAPESAYIRALTAADWKYVALDTRFRCERARLQERLAAWIADTAGCFALPAI